MEALNLPPDMIWECESTTSPFPSYLNSEEIIIFEDSFASETSIPDYDDLLKPDPNSELQLSVEQFREFEELLQIQEDLELVSESDSIASSAESNMDQWLDQPINVPLDEYAIQTIHDARVQTVKANTAQLLNEFNHVYNSVEFTHLTPPQTPPQISPETSPRAYLDDSSKNQYAYYSQPCIGNITDFQLPQYDQQQQCIPSLPAQQFSTLFEQAINLVEESVGSHEDNKVLAEVEALVRSRAEDLECSMDDDSSSLSGSSFSCFSPNSEISSTNTDDSDWTANTDQNESIGAVGAALKANPTRKRKPRSSRRSHEDRSIRKKEQNKNAANRYRMKKKAEIEILCDEERDLLKHNESLKTRLADVSREVKCMKNLLRELFREKGLID